MAGVSIHAERVMAAVITMLLEAHRVVHVKGLDKLDYRGLNLIKPRG